MSAARLLIRDLLLFGGLGFAFVSPSAYADRPADDAASVDVELEVRDLNAETIIQTRDDDTAYWAGRMQQAMLPQASLRAKLSLRSADPNRPIESYAGRLVRVESPSSIRSLVTIETPRDARRIVKVESRAQGGAERVVYSGASGSRGPLRVDAQQPIPLTSLTYEDLGFVPLGHRVELAVEFEASSDRAVVRLVSEPYGEYGRVVTRLERTTALPIDVEYFDKRGLLMRRVTYSKIDREGPYSFPLRIESEDFRSGVSTTVDLSEVEIGPPIYEYEFSDAHLKLALRAMR